AGRGTGGEPWPVEGRPLPVLLHERRRYRSTSHLEGADSRRERGAADERRFDRNLSGCARIRQAGGGAERGRAAVAVDRDRPSGRRRCANHLSGTTEGLSDWG